LARLTSTVNSKSIMARETVVETASDMPLAAPQLPAAPTPATPAAPAPAAPAPAK
jgi:hypothetical protein